MTVSFAHAAGFFDPQSLIQSAGPLGLLLVCAIVFCETGLLVGFVLPGDTLLFFTGLLTFTGTINLPVWVVIVGVIVAAVLGDQLGYFIGYRAGPAVFERKESGFFSRASVKRTDDFYRRFGPHAITIARFVPVVRTFAPVAAGVAKMRYRTFLTWNIIGGVVWPVLIISLGYLLGHIPGVAGFVSSYIDIVLIGIVVISVVPILVRLVVRRFKQKSAA
ncbi:MAG: Membrane protein [Glaciihabitans sp.]|nr:Membrane protein [Glaciihabitans sp.]